jgi:hypothetical protein
MADETAKLELPRSLQIEMLKFFLRTSAPRKQKLKSQPLSDKNDRGERK